MEKYLSHFGIPNMRWGIRRYQNKDGSLTPLGKDRYRKNKPGSTEQKERKPEIKEKKYPNVESLSDDELNSILKRLRNESEYAKLTASNSVENEKRFKKYASKFGDTLMNSIVEGSAKSISNALIKAVFGENAPGKKN